MDSKERGKRSLDSEPSLAVLALTNLILKATEDLSLRNPVISAKCVADYKTQGNNDHK